MVPKIAPIGALYPICTDQCPLFFAETIPTLTHISKLDKRKYGMKGWVGGSKQNQKVNAVMSFTTS